MTYEYMYRDITYVKFFLSLLYDHLTTEWIAIASSFLTR